MGKKSKAASAADATLCYPSTIRGTKGIRLQRSSGVNRMTQRSKFSACPLECFGVAFPMDQVFCNVVSHVYGAHDQMQHMAGCARPQRRCSYGIVLRNRAAYACLVVSDSNARRMTILFPLEQVFFVRDTALRIRPFFFVLTISFRTILWSH